MQTENLPILVDQDGVLADFVGGLYTELKLFVPPAEFALLPDPAKLTTFYVEDSINTGVPKLDQKLKSLIREIVDNFPYVFGRLPAITGAVKYVKLLAEKAAEMNIDVIICTAPHVENKTCHSDKASWANYRLGPPWAKNMIMTHDKTLVQGLLLIDDKPVIKGRIKPTWEHVVFGTSYNKDSKGFRVEGWSEETVNAILRRAQQKQVLNGLS
jgi:5'-nucleotidase